MTIFGRGGHGARPDTTIDPVLLTAHIIVRLQSIVSREVRPGELGVISTGSIIAGETANIIPDEARFKLTIRAYSLDLQKRLVESVKRVVRAECQASGVEKEPQINTIMQAPSTVNDEKLTVQLKESFDAHFGHNSVPLDPFPASEDFSVLARSIEKPYLFWVFGGTDEKKWDDAVSSGTVMKLPWNVSHLDSHIHPQALITAAFAFVCSGNTTDDENGGSLLRCGCPDISG